MISSENDQLACVIQRGENGNRLWLKGLACFVNEDGVKVSSRDAQVVELSGHAAGGHDYLELEQLLEPRLHEANSRIVSRVALVHGRDLVGSTIPGHEAQHLALGQVAAQALQQQICGHVRWCL